MAGKANEPETEAADAEAIVEPAVVEAEAAIEPAIAPASEPAAEPAVAAPVVEAPGGTAYMDHPDPNASASYLGAEIVRDAKGLFLVPLHAIEQLIAHGFTLVSEVL